MLYQSELELPRDVRDVLPATALDLYRKTYNQTWRVTRADDERSRERAAHAAAWRRVKQSFAKDNEGLWVSRMGVAKVNEDW
jgi:cation transport regulator ChaB